MADYTYCRTRWTHGLNSYPLEIWSELDGYRFERRRLEIYQDGRRLWTSPEEWRGADRATTPLPGLDELADDSDCESAVAVTSDQFEAAWAMRSRT